MPGSRKLAKSDVSVADMSVRWYWSKARVQWWGRVRNGMVGLEVSTV